MRQRLEWTPPQPDFAPREFVGDTLEEYLPFILKQGPVCPAAPFDGFWWHDIISGVTIHQQGEFQAQLYICKPDSEIPEHSHPNVDTYEVHVNGDLRFYVGGIPVVALDHLADQRNGISRWWGRAVRVRAGVLHRLEVGRTGTAFVSVQRWLNGIKPRRSVGLDWDGPACNQNHADVLKAPRSDWRETDVQDAIDAQAERL